MIQQDLTYLNDSELHILRSRCNLEIAKRNDVKIAIAIRRIFEKYPDARTFEINVGYNWGHEDVWYGGVVNFLVDDNNLPDEDYDELTGSADFGLKFLESEGDYEINRYVYSRNFNDIDDCEIEQTND